MPVFVIAHPERFILPLCTPIRNNSNISLKKTACTFQIAKSPPRIELLPYFEAPADVDLMSLSQDVFHARAPHVCLLALSSLLLREHRRQQRAAATFIPRRCPKQSSVCGYAVSRRPQASRRSSVVHPVLVPPERGGRWRLMQAASPW